MSIEKIESDEDTAYDEVISDLKGLSHKYLKDPVKQVFLRKLEQLGRLLDDEEKKEE